MTSSAKLSAAPWIANQTLIQRWRSPFLILIAATEELSNRIPTAANSVDYLTGLVKSGRFFSNGLSLWWFAVRLNRR